MTKSWMALAALTFAGSVLVLLPACDDQRSEFRVVEITPARSPSTSRLRLNEPLTIRFSEAVDPSSLSGESVHVVGGDRRVAAGRLVASGDRITFVPQPVAAADLKDGGYRPAEQIRIALTGFPNRDGVMSIGGTPLFTPFRATFDVVDVDGSEAGAFAAFVDSQPGTPPRLSNLDRLRGAAGGALVHPDGSVLLVFNKPLAPRTVDAAAIDLRFDNLDRTPVETEALLIQGEDRAEIRVRPKAGFQRGTRYLLLVKPGRLCDVVGNRIEDVPPLAIGTDESGALLLGGVPASSP